MSRIFLIKPLRYDMKIGCYRNGENTTRRCSNSMNTCAESHRYGPAHTSVKQSHGALVARNKSLDAVVRNAYEAKYHGSNKPAENCHHSGSGKTVSKYGHGRCKR